MTHTKKEVKKVVLEHQILRLQIETAKQFPDEMLISFLCKDILSLVDQINILENE
jgi:hypothetical protein